jgi:predicted PurR-regulated permease PerM
MSEQPERTSIQFTTREHRWLTTLLILATIVAGFVVTGFVTGLLAFFSDVIMIFFLAWLLAFILSPLANGLLHLVPRLPRAIAVVIVYALLILAVLALLVVLAQQLYGSINTLLGNWPKGEQLRTVLQPWQDRLTGVGLGQISLYDQVNQMLDNLRNGAADLAKPLGDVAVASLGVFGNLLFVFFLSLYMAVDRDHIMSFLFRLVPPGWTEEARLLEHSVARSFGGFLRGQALTGVIYGLVSMLTSVMLGLPYMPVTAVTSGVLQAIPFFGPFVSWLPPVLVAVFFKADVVLPVLVIMIAGWFVLMNVIQPRLMSEAVGLHPVVVLGSVMVGSKLAGIPGAIFGIPVTAVVASFFFYYLGRNRDPGSVALRAARRVEEREGRPVRVPRLPQAGEDQEVEPSPAPPVTTTVRRLARITRAPMAQARLKATPPADATADAMAEPVPTEPGPSGPMPDPKP